MNETRENVLALHKFETRQHLALARQARLDGDMTEFAYHFRIAQFTIYYMLRGLD